MTLLVVILFSILLAIGAGIIVYLIYTTLELREEFKNTTVRSIFMAEYYRIRKQREEQWTTSSDTD